MKIVMVTKFVPWPADSGGKRRSLAVAQALARVGDVTLCAFQDASSRPAELTQEHGIDVRAVPWRPRPSKVVAGLARGRSLTAARFWDPALYEEVRAAAQPRVDHLQIEYTQLAPYARGITAARRLLDMHNVESALMASYARTRRGPAKLLHLEAAALRRLENRAVADFDATAVVSHADARLLDAPKAIIAPNGWAPTEAPLPAATGQVAAFVALMGWAPNDDAAQWLCRSIWPLVRARVRDAQLLLVGRDPSDAVRALAGPGVEVTGTVPDVRPHLERARVGLAPLRAGGGSRLKVLESLDAGRPVVATTKGVEGLEDLVGNGVVVADEPEELADAIAGLLADPEWAESLGLQGRAAVAERHSWESTLQPLIDAVTGAGSRRPGGRA
jgi:hypothetical protein